MADLFMVWAAGFVLVQSRFTFFPSDVVLMFVDSSGAQSILSQSALGCIARAASLVSCVSGTDLKIGFVNVPLYGTRR